MSRSVLQYRECIMTQAPIMLATKPFTGTPGPLAVAQWLAVREARPLRLICVIDPFEGTGDDPLILPPRYVEEDRTWIAKRIDAALHRSPYARLDTEVEVVDGSVPGTLERIAHEQSVALLVMGRGRRGGLRGALAQQVLRTARVPLLIVPAEATARPLKYAVVAVDFTEASVRAAAHVLPLMASEGRLTLGHVRSVPDDAIRDPRSLELYASQCSAAFGRIIRSLPLMPGIAVDTVVLDGNVVGKIEDLVVARHADIVACGRRSPGASPELLLGSVSALLVEHARIPVLVAPDTGGAAHALSTAAAGMSAGIWPGVNSVVD